METMLSERGKRLIIYKGYKFYLGRVLKNGETAWRCTRKGCKTQLYTLGNIELPNFSRVSDCNHNHESESELVLNRQKISNSVKRKANDDVSERPAKIIHREISKNIGSIDTLSVKDVKYIRDNYNREKLKTLPKLPRNIQEVHAFVNDSVIKTVKSEDFLLINDSVNNLIVFSCETNIKLMAESSLFYMDGTFNYCCKFFCQLFTIHTYVNNTYVPTVFCLLPNKNKKTYENLFHLLNEKISSWLPEKIVVDFEVAIHSAIEEVFPNAEIIGCRFHLAQAWWRKIQQVGLSREYKNGSSEIGKWLKHLFGLTFLPANLVNEIYCFNFIADMPQDDRVLAFSDYLVENYIDNQSRFPPHIWAANNAELNRTTNSCESYHSKFNKMCNSPHPNIHTFLKALEELQKDTYIKINSAQFKEKRVIRKEVVNNFNFINNKILQLKAKEISLYAFVIAVSYKFSA